MKSKLNEIEENQSDVYVHRGVATLKTFDSKRWVRQQSGSRPVTDVVPNNTLHIRLDSVLGVVRSTEEGEHFGIYLEFRADPLAIASTTSVRNLQLEADFLKIWKDHVNK